uniref:Uncharacterized protein n=1 Tax=Eutreptiella gymnastica TaxID=73025 RepID=A0A7S4LLI0_9EUGL
MLFVVIVCLLWSAEAVTQKIMLHRLGETTCLANQGTLRSISCDILDSDQHFARDSEALTFSPNSNPGKCLEVRSARVLGLAQLVVATCHASVARQQFHCNDNRCCSAFKSQTCVTIAHLAPATDVSGLPDIFGGGGGGKMGDAILLVLAIAPLLAVLAFGVKRFLLSEGNGAP